MGLLLFFIFGGVACIGAKFYRDFKDSKSTDENKKNKAITFAIIGLAGMIFSFQFREQPSQHGISSNSTTASKTVQKKSCWRCGKDLSNTVDWIQTDPNMYECTPCYEITQSEIKDELSAEGYNTK